MNRFFSESECVGTTRFQNGTAHVFAAIEARYHADQREVVVSQSAYLSPDDMHHIGEHVKAAWLPEGETVKAACDSSEASDVARDILHSWVRHVKESIPN